MLMKMRCLSIVNVILQLSSVDEVLTAHRGTQTNIDSSSTCTADCEARFEVKLRDFRARVDRELEEKMQDALQSLEQRVCLRSSSSPYNCATSSL